MSPTNTRGWSRRRFLRAATAAGVLSGISGGASANATGWQLFKQQFIENGERVVDTGNNHVSHSESQGWGLLFAEAFADRQTFERVWAWTNATLRRPDGLYSWRWTRNAKDPVADKNNASDGDILIAWALARAGRRWDVAPWRDRSKFLQGEIVNRLTLEMNGRLVLLPGIDGFRRNANVVVNLSYYVWPALDAFAQSSGDSRWLRLSSDGMWLLDSASFGSERLPPDWLLYGKGTLAIADGWPPRFSYDAVRIPLYLAWKGDSARLGRYVSAWRAKAVAGRPPAWIDLNSGAVPDYPSSGGYAAVAALLQRVLSNEDSATLPAVAKEDDYYSASLKLLSCIAAREARP